MSRRRATNGAMAPIDLQHDSLGYAIKLAQVRTYALLYRMARLESLSPARMTTLSFVSMQPGINQSALAARLNITRASVQKVVDALEAMGYLSREAIPGDRRSYALMLTPAGYRQLVELRENVDQYEVEIAARLSMAERKKLIELLGKVAATENALEAPEPTDE